MELLQASGLAERLSRLMAPVLRPLFGSASQDKQAMEAVSANVTANLLGLSNAATPLRIACVRAAARSCRAERSAGYRADADRAERNLNSADSVYGGGGSCGLRSTRAI